MLACFTFLAKPGKEKEFEDLLNNPEAGKAVARGLGALRNTLFLGDGRMVRVLEFPPEGPRKTLGQLARESPEVARFLAKLAPLIQNGFDPSDPASLEAFNRRAMVPAAYDVHA
jgi:hypothetical protein